MPATDPDRKKFFCLPAFSWQRTLLSLYPFYIQSGELIPFMDLFGGLSLRRLDIYS